MLEMYHTPDLYAWRDATSEPMAPGVYFPLLKTSPKILLFVVPFYMLSIYQFLQYRAIYPFVTSRTRSLPTFLKHLGHECLVSCVHVLMTLFGRRTPSGLINLGSQSSEIFIGRLLHSYTWGLPNHPYERASTPRLVNYERFNSRIITSDMKLYVARQRA